MSDDVEDDESDTQLNLLLKQMRSAQTPADSVPHEATEMLARLRQIPGDVQAEKTWIGAEDYSTLPFQKIGQYELLERIAGGGMGEVFKARHQKLGNVVAIKLLHRDRVVDRQLLERFEQEMRAVGRLNHEHIVKPLYADEQDGMPYLVMEHVEGQTLATVLEEYATAGETFPIALACESIRQAAIGLAHAHQHGIIHRDIKPSNLMLTGANALRSRSRETSDADSRTGQSIVIKILDLGLARLNEPASDDIQPRQQEDDKQPRRKELTREGQVMGTPDYMAPEQLENSHHVDARTDIYALGTTLFKLLAGRTPYADAGNGSLTAKLQAITSKPTPAVSQFRSDVPSELDALVLRMMSKSSNDRPQTAMEVAEALRPFADAVGRALLPAAASEPAKEHVPRSHRRSSGNTFARTTNRAFRRRPRT